MAIYIKAPGEHVTRSGAPVKLAQDATTGRWFGFIAAARHEWRNDGVCLTAGTDFDIVTAKTPGLNWCSLMIGDNGARLLTCSCGRFGVAEPTLRVCPACGQVPTVQLVECAHPTHNDQNGCRNSKCWKARPKARLD